MAQLAVSDGSEGQHVGGPALLEQVMTAVVIAFVLANLMLVVEWGSYERSLAFLWAGIPALLALATLITGFRPLAELVIGLCFGIGLLGMLSVGMRLWPLGICLLVWHMIRSRRLDQQAFSAESLLLMNVGLFPAVFLLFRVLFIRH